jgi:hypothetical protein
MKTPSLLVMVAVVAVALAPVSAALASDATPSTNDQNREKGWAHVNEIDVGIGTVLLDFISTRNFYSCFEYRPDGDESQRMLDDDGIPRANFNLEITDGLYPFFCLSNETRAEVLFASQYVEVRMVFGAEKDERFDWTRFDVAGGNGASKFECMNGAWKNFGFRNQGQCIRFLETGHDSR